MSSHGRVTRQRTFPPFTSLLRPNALSGKKDVDSVTSAMRPISAGGMIHGNIDPEEMRTNKDAIRKILQMPENKPFLRRLKESHISIFKAMVNNPDTLWNNLADTLSSNDFGYPLLKQMCHRLLNAVGNYYIYTLFLNPTTIHHSSLHRPREVSCAKGFPQWSNGKTLRKSERYLSVRKSL